MADLTEVELLRYDIQDAVVAETVYIDCSNSGWQGSQLRDLDRVIVPAKTRNLPFVISEGAVFRERTFRSDIGYIRNNHFDYYVGYYAAAIRRFAICPGFFSSFQDRSLVF